MIVRLAHVFQQQARADTGRLVDHRQAAARVRASTCQVYALEVLEAVARPEVQHLAQIMRQVKNRATMDGILLLPVIRGEHALVPDQRTQIGQAQLAELVEGQLAVTGRLFFPVDVRVHVRNQCG